MNPSEISKTNLIYTRWASSGKSKAEKVGWHCTKDQTSRFEQFLKLQKLTKKSFVHSSILEVGCGDAQLIDFLRKQGITTVDFTGIDINESFVKTAKETFSGTFIHDEFLSHEFNKTFDFVFASGIFNVNVFQGNTERAYELLFRTVDKMVDLTNQGIAFNFLSKQQSKDFILSGNMQVYDTNKIFKWVKEKGFKTKLVEGYDELDSTILIAKSKIS
ncbi:hypothetical protein COV18_07515 [Candidatus Woesearchaeota archaeon CG10_big_fil_rev_8_21_14_0_10_37_12]|nr:MAG: hypothetical protein COV18_07515 [Candidatus Woesearchaeota archaeon CG10_big_fil_rev_8_21_14_0_10_37_12]